MMVENNLNRINLLRNLNYDPTRCIVTNLIPTLEFMAFSRVAISLWKNLRSKLIGREYHSNIVQQEMGEKISSLVIPKCFKKTLEQIIETNIIEILEILRSLFPKYYISHELLFENACWTQQGTINISKTISLILQRSNINKFRKLAIACDFFLEDKIRFIIENEPMNFQEKLEYMMFNFITHSTYRFDLIDFWSSYIRTSELPPLINELPAGEHLLKFAAIHNNIAVPYIWQNFIDDSVKNRIIEFTQHVPFVKDNYNILFYFYTQMNEAQLREVEIKFYRGVIKQICSIGRWSAVVSVSEFLLDLIKIRSAIDSIYIIIYSWCKHSNFFNFIEYQFIWYKFGVQFKLDMERNIIELVEKTIDNEFHPKMVLITLSLLLRTTTDEDKQKVLYNSKLMKFCNKLVTLDNNAMEDLSYIFIKIFKEESFIKFKKNFFRNEGVDICLFYIKEQNFEIADKFLAYFCVTDDIREFKKKLPYENNAKILNYFVLFDFDLEKLKNFFMWCFKGNEEETENCKAVLFDFDLNSNRVLKQNIIWKLENFFTQTKFEIFGEFWNFIFNATKEKIDTPNEKMRRIKKIILFSEIYNTLPLNVNSKIDNRLFKRFVTKCLDPDEADSMEELKRKEDLFFVVRSLAKYSKLKELIKALDWFYSSDKSKINEFKEAVIRFCLSLILFDIFKYNRDEFSIEEIFCTFLTSVRLANMFKEIFAEFIKQKMNLAIETDDFLETICLIHMEKDITELFETLERCNQRLLKKEKDAKNEFSSLFNQNGSVSNSSSRINFSSISKRFMCVSTIFLVSGAIYVITKHK